MNIKLRPSNIQDCPQILATQAAAIRELCAGEYTADQIEAWASALSEDDLKPAIESGASIVAVGDAGIVGFGELDANRGEVAAIYVHPGHARLGLGTMLFQALESRARAAGSRQLTLTSSLTAVPFYERFGFVAEPATVRRLAGGAEIPVVPMRRTF